ncbi:hypothetical protein S7335_3306 [Synechococcus sp. PCC 7335]|nr:hypothetical protein S7335_3306 [Synechococcus sp. PCC 7335]
MSDTFYQILLTSVTTQLEKTLSSKLETAESLCAIGLVFALDAFI